MMPTARTLLVLLAVLSMTGVSRAQLVDPKLPRGGLTALAFPCFIKPVKGAFSVMSGRLDSWEDLEEFLSRPSVPEFLAHYVFMFDRLVRELTHLERGAGWFLAEELLKGRQVTVEGYALDGDVEILGIVDTVRHPSTRSFVRFDYPSSLARRVQARLRDVAVAVVRRLGLRHTLFNVEMMYDVRRDRVFIIEVNPRMCGQFADLYEKVDGRSGYDVALALAVGERPRERRRTPLRVASSFPAADVCCGWGRWTQWRSKRAPASSPSARSSASRSSSRWSSRSG